MRTIALALVVLVGATGLEPASAHLVAVGPVTHALGFADPSVARYSGGYVAVSTGRGAPLASAVRPTGPWHWRGRALASMPHWARSRKVWASDIVKVRHRWLLYYSAPVRGLGKYGRCIGVATARSPFGRFHSVGRRPLVCPRAARVPRARDQLRHHGRHMPRGGVIDPSGFGGRDGTRYLLYKTQNYPSSIRIVRLNGHGTGVHRHQYSRVLLRRPGIVENPVLVRHHRHIVLFTSEGYFGGCGYRTTWRRAESLGGLWSARPHVLLQRSQRGICGPGGADVVTRGRRPPLMFFHGWTCWSSWHACPANFKIGRARRLRARRSLFAAHLNWTRSGTPHVRGFLRPT